LNALISFVLIAAAVFFFAAALSAAGTAPDGLEGLRRCLGKTCSARGLSKAFRL
jgi:hypothetical protein